MESHFFYGYGQWTTQGILVDEKGENLKNRQNEDRKKATPNSSRPLLIPNGKLRSWCTFLQGFDYQVLSAKTASEGTAAGWKLGHVLVDLTPLFEPTLNPNRVIMSVQERFFRKLVSIFGTIASFTNAIEVAYPSEGWRVTFTLHGQNNIKQERKSFSYKFQNDLSNPISSLRSTISCFVRVIVGMTRCREWKKCGCQKPVENCIGKVYFFV